MGDNVEFDVLSEEQSLGNIVEILPRENSLIRPAVANIDQAMIVFAVAFQSTVNLRKCHIIGCQYHVVREVHDLHLTGLYAVRAADPV